MKRLLTHLGLRFFLLFSCIFLSSFFISLSAQEFVKGGANGFEWRLIGRVFFDGTGTEPLIGRTMAFAVLSLSQVAHAFNMRSEHSIFHIGVFKNRKLVIAALACIALQASVILIPPLSAVFKTAHLGILQWAIVIGLALVPIVVVEIEKLLFRMIRALFPPKEKSHKKVNKKEAKQL